MGLKLKHSGGNSVSLLPPTNNPSSDISFKLPQADGSANQHLKTDGSGNLGWATDQAGKILKIASTTKTDIFTSSSASWVDVTGLTVDIEPTAASSKIFVFASGVFGNANSTGSGARLMRGSTAIGIAVDASHSSTIMTGSANPYNTSGDFSEQYTMQFLDSPTYTLGDTLTYKVQAFPGGYTMAFGGGTATGDSSGRARGINTITVWEVGA